MTSDLLLASQAVWSSSTLPCDCDLDEEDLKPLSEVCAALLEVSDSNWADEVLSEWCCSEEAEHVVAALAAATTAMDQPPISDLVNDTSMPLFSLNSVANSASTNSSPAIASTNLGHTSASSCNRSSSRCSSSEYSLLQCKAQSSTCTVSANHPAHHELTSIVADYGSFAAKGHHHHGYNVAGTNSPLGSQQCASYGPSTCYYEPMAGPQSPPGHCSPPSTAYQIYPNGYDVLATAAGSPPLGHHPVVAAAAPAPPPPATPHFNSMSVNLTATMTMGFASPAPPPPSAAAFHHDQWSCYQNGTIPSQYHHGTIPGQYHHGHGHAAVSNGGHGTANGSPYQHHLHHSQPAPAPTTPAYSFTAEFRPSELRDHYHHSASQPPNQPSTSATLSEKESPSLSPPIASVVSHTGTVAAGHCYPLRTNVRKSGNHHLSNLRRLSTTVGHREPLANGASGLGPNGGNQQHHGSVTGSGNLCRICGKTYARPSTLKTHLRTHSGERPYRCSTCHKSFSQAANLTAHIRTHSGEKPFRCAICDRRFSQSSSVTTHMRTHSGERPYRCCMCRKAFSDSSTLTKHLRTHSGEKPYQCKLCQLRFSQSGNLNRHMRIHAVIA